MPPRDGKPITEPRSPGQGKLSGRVEACLKQLGNGFLRHPANEELRRLLVAPSEDRISSPEQFFRQLIVVAYQLLMLQVCQDRGLWPQHLSRLRERLHDPNWLNNQDDLWRTLSQQWWCGGEAEHPSTDIPRFVDESLSARPLGGCSISNRDLLQAFAHIAWYVDGDEGPVGYSTLDIEELGAVYESLLELRPMIEGETDATGRHALRLELVAGSQRKHSGSYYTPPELIEELIQSTLKPLVEQRLAVARQLDENTRQAAAEQAILSLRVCDPACGTGHFLLAAARWLGKELARIRTGDREPDQEATHAAVADVIAYCVYGVDQNPMAVDLCRFALWLEGRGTPAVSASLPRQIRCGDALVGGAGNQPSLELPQQMASQHNFFHWPLEFPEVFAQGGFDVVLGNPPWLSYTGRHKVSIAPSHLNYLTTRFPAIRRWPCAHAAFLLLARDLLRQGGRCGLVLPRQLADLDSFEPVRQALATDMHLVGSVRDVGEDAFEGVTQPVGLYCFARTGPGSSNWPIEQRVVSNGSASLARSTTRPLPAPLASLLDWCDKQPAFPARTFSDPGVHTGNISRKLILNELREVPCGRLELVREGKDLTAFHLSPPRKWVWIAPPLIDGEYCRIGDGDHYRRVPILLRQTANRPIAARHLKPTYFRNSVLACHGLQHVPDRVLVGFLNSSLYAFLHQARFKDPGQRAFPQVKIKHLHSLPQPPLVALLADGGTLMQQIETIVAQSEQAAERGESSAALAAQLDVLVLRAFDLPETLASLLRNHLV